MGKTCCAVQCQNKTGTSDSSFFRFPKTPERRELWVRRINRRRFQPTRHTVLCSDHFTTDDVVNGSAPKRVVRRRLMPGAVPTLLQRAEGAWVEGDGVARSEDDEDVQQEEAEEGGRSSKDVSGAADGGLGRTHMQLREKRPRKVLTEFVEAEEEEMEATSVQDAASSDEDAAAAADMASGSFDILVNNAEEGEQNDDVLTQEPEDDVLTQKQEGDVLTLKQEGDVLTLKQEGDVLSLKQEGDVLSLKQEGDVLTQPDHEDGASTASPPTSTSKASKRKWPPLKICQRPTKQLMLDIISSSSTSSLAPGPVLYCLDPDFCSVHTVFEVPLNKPSPLISRSPNMSTPRENSPHISITTAEQKPSTHPMTQETVTTEKILKGEPCPGSVKGDGSLSTPCPEPPVLERQKEVGGSPCSETDHSANDMAEVCTLACCSASASSWLSVAGIPIKQEVMDHDSDHPPFHNPSELQPLPVAADDTEQADLERLVPRSSTPTAVPYRSQPLHLAAQASNLQTPSRHPVPYRSEPLRAHLPAANPLRQEPSPGELAKRAPPANDDLDYVPTVERSAKSRTSSPIKSGARLVTSQSAAASEAAFSPNVMAGPRGLLAQRLLQGVPEGQGGQQAIGSSSSSSGSTVVDDVLSWTSQSLTPSFAVPHPAVHTQLGLQTVLVPLTVVVSHPAVHTQLGLQTVLVPLTTAYQVSNVSPSQATSSLQLSSDPIFIRSEHVMVDLMDVFKHSSNKIHNGTVFKFCSRVGTTAGGDNGLGSMGPPSQPLPARVLKDVSHKKLFTVFWKECLATHFEGYQEKVPRLELQGRDHDVPYLLGQVLRHGLLLCGYWPVAMSPACAVNIISGDMCSSHILLQSLRKVMYPFEAQTLEDLRDSAVAALDPSTQAALDHSTQAARSDILRSLQVGEVGRREKVERYLAVRGEKRVGHVVDTYGGSNCKVPTAPEELEAFIVELASFYLYRQPFWILREIRRGFLTVTEHTWGAQDYLNALTEQKVLDMYKALVPTPQALIPRLIFIFPSGGQFQSIHWKTCEYLVRSLLRLSPHDLRTLLERWNQADCLLDACYNVLVASNLDSAVSGMGHVLSPYFRSAENLLVLPAKPITLPAFHNTIRSLLATGSRSCRT